MIALKKGNFLKFVLIVENSKALNFIPYTNDFNVKILLIDTL